jgi:hypothetical protein
MVGERGGLLVSVEKRFRSGPVAGLDEGLVAVEDQGEAGPVTQGRDDLDERTVVEVEPHLRGAEQPLALDQVGDLGDPPGQVTLGGLPSLGEGRQCRAAEFLEGACGVLALGGIWRRETGHEDRRVGVGSPGTQGHDGE